MNEDPLQPLPLFIRCDLAADTDVRDRRHEDKEPPWQRNVTRNPSALLGDRLLGNLNENLLAGLQQVADDRQVRGLHGTPRRSTPVPLAPAPAPAAPTAVSALTPLCLGCRLTIGRDSL